METDFARQNNHIENNSEAGLSPDAEKVLQALIRRQKQRQKARARAANHTDYYGSIYRQTFGADTYCLSTPSSVRNLDVSTPRNHSLLQHVHTGSKPISRPLFEPETPTSVLPISSSLKDETTLSLSNSTMEISSENSAQYHGRYDPSFPCYMNESGLLGNNYQGSQTGICGTGSEHHLRMSSSSGQEFDFASHDVDQYPASHGQSVSHAKDCEDLVYNARQSLFSRCSSQTADVSARDDVPPSPPLDLSPNENGLRLGENYEISEFKNGYNTDKKLSTPRSSVEGPASPVLGSDLTIESDINMECSFESLDESNITTKQTQSIFITPKGTRCAGTKENSTGKVSSISRRLSELKKLSESKKGNVEVSDAAKPGTKRPKPPQFSIPVKRAAVKDGNQKVDEGDSAPSTNKIPHATDLSQNQRNRLVHDLTTADELAMTLLYTDGSSQLRERCSQKKLTASSDTKPEYLALAYPVKDNAVLTQTETVTIKYVLFNMKNDTDEWSKDTVDRIMASSCRKLCFESQELIHHLIKIYNYDSKHVVEKWCEFIDPKVAVWLLDPDNPVITFKQTLASLKQLKQQEDSSPNEDAMSALSLLGPAFLQLYHKLQRDDLWQLYTKLEMPLSPVLAVMETRGIHVDTKSIIHSTDLIKRQLSELEKEAHQSAGHSFLISSHHQLRQVLFDELKLDVKLTSDRKLARTSKSQQKSTSEAVLQQLIPLHPLPRIVLQHRQLQKLKCTYMDSILSCVEGGKIYTHWDLTSAATGRLASYNPNLQSIPKQPTIVTKRHKFIVGKEDVDEEVHARASFVSAPHTSLIAFDFQQIELRILAHLTQDPGLLQLFNQPPDNNVDIFTELSSEWLGKPSADVTAVDREQTKRVVYSVMYGVGKERLAEYLKTSPTNAKALMTSFLGYHTSIFKRRRYFPNINSSNPQLRAQAERQAVNFRVQGSAADICKAAMLKVERVLARSPDIQARLLVQIHDELLLETPDEQIEKTMDIVRVAMETCTDLWQGVVTLSLPLTVSVSTGKSWASLQPYTKPTPASQSPDFICD